ncbi:WASH complex subunit 2 [Wyeomyia smithii]|uniref:WASH complex subunit 2 n=1 Tax=Wyeomyia smithii TaxID=174621 RepID=UPI002467C63C|nr:WASH complex subunit 2 [Wyeomyia smithii]
MALTPDELRKNIPNWSLESDGQLLQYMVEISKNLEAKCKKTKENLNQLLLELNDSQIRFANASNNFNGVQQVKYVENRVKDDDESFYSVREEVVETGEKYSHAEIFKMTVQRSITNMYKCFERVTVQLDSDSDSEDDSNDAEVTARNTVLRAIQKYPYINRPLPYVIGSPEWKEKWHVGLIDSEEESETECKEQYSDSSDSERIFPSQTNSNHTPSESEGSVWGVHSDPRRRDRSMEPSVSGEDTLSIHSTSSSIRPPVVKTLRQQNKVQVLPFGQQFRPPSLFQDQPPEDTISVSSSRSKMLNLFDESDKEDSTPAHQAKPQPVINQPAYFRGNLPERQTVNLFDDEPPSPCLGRTGNLSSTTAGKTQHKKSVNLFIESDEEEDMTNNNDQISKSVDIFQSEPREKRENLAKPATNLFTSNDNVRLGQSVVQKPAGHIFDEDNNNPYDEDDLFVPVQKSVNGSGDGRSVLRITNLFDDEPPVDDFDEIFKSKATTHKPIGGKLVLPVAPLLPKRGDGNHNESVSESNAEKTEVIRDEHHRVSNEYTAHKPIESQKQIATDAMISKKVNLFDDNDDDQDLFATMRQTNKSAPISKINLFDDEDDSFLFASKDDNPVVANILETKSPQVGSSKQNTSIRSEILKKKSIFDSDSAEQSEEDKPFDSLKINKSNGSLSSRTESLPQKEQTGPSAQFLVDDIQRQASTSIAKPVISSTEVNSLDPSEHLSPLVEEPIKNPEISNEIDYYLITPKKSGNKETSLPEVKTQAANVDEFESNDSGDAVQSHVDEIKVVEKDKHEIERQTDDSIAHTIVVSQPSEENTSVAKCALNFSSMGLFDDVPPPDDNIFEEARSSITLDHSDDPGFYAGQTSARTAISSDSINRSRYLFMDDEGPPPDDLNPQLAKDEVDDLLSSRQTVKSISSIVENDKCSGVSNENKREKSKINKLSAKVNINVNALLPGARRPPTVDNKSDSEATVSEIQTIIQQNNSFEPENSAGKLVGLNKDRARIQVKRKPSSRQHRRAHYENTVQGHSSILTASGVQSQQDTHAEEIRVVVGSEMKSQHVEITANDIVSNPLISNQLPSELLQQKIFEVKDDEDKLVNNQPVESKSVKSEPKTLLPTSILSGETSKPPEITVAADKSKRGPSTRKLFSDSETDDDDDLFGELTKHVTVSKPVTLIVDQTKSTPQSIQKITSVATKVVDTYSAPSKASQSKSIFDDSDDENDYLFSKPNPKTQPTPVMVDNAKFSIKTANHKNKSIFGSDDEEESDDLFGSKATKHSSVTAASMKITKPPIQTKSLFGDDDDDDDDDDLFGSKGRPTIKPTSSFTGIKKPDSNRTKMSTTVASNDPLADLFG